jgi:addiction module RelE/StbE family toxin
MPVKWLRIALGDLDEIATFVSRDNRAAAEKLVGEIREKAELLAEHPEMGRPGRVAGTRELYVEDSRYIIPYRAKGGVVEILRILHTSRRWPAGFK